MSLVFEEALKRLPEEREVYLNETCADDPMLRARVEKLLAHDRCASRDDFLAPPSTPLAMMAILGEANRSTAVETAESRMRYRTVRAHAKGGLGEVLVVHDEQLHRDVALKLIQREHDSNSDSRRRFLVEAEVTAQLEHPGIVPVHGLAETDDGRPCYTMRFIQGESLQEAIDKFHTADKPGRDPGERSLALRQLLTQFITVCKTVAYAHSRGILHRDLKPANIMLGKYGETLVVDWGLAKRVSDERLVVSDQGPGSESGQDVGTDYELGTATGDVIGTPAYMSPEQAWGDALGPASDIYSLGATLYVILTGVAPIDGENALARARQGGFLAPRRRKKEIPLALERICLKAIALKPEGRYGSALELAADLEHWLADEPVAAYREPWLARLRRWGRRHRPLVTGLAAALVVGLVALTAGLVVVSGLNRRLDAANVGLVQKSEDLDARNADLVQSNAKEEQARKQAENVLSYFVQVFRRADPAQDGEEVTIVEVLKRSEQELRNKTHLDPAMRGMLLDAIGQTYMGLGLPNEAVDILEQAVALCREHLGADHVATFHSKNKLGVAYKNAGRLPEALLLLEETLKVARANLGPQHHTTLVSMNNLAAAYQRAGRLSDALPLLEETLKLSKAKLGPEHPDTLRPMNNLALAYRSAGRLSDALPLLEETLNLQRIKLSPEHPDTLTTMNNLALAYRDAGRLSDALLLLEETLKLSKAKLGPEHPDTLRLMSNLALAYRDAGRLSDAAPLLEETLKLRKAKLGPEHPDTLTSMNNLALVYRDARRLSDALPLFEERLKLLKPKLGPEHPDTLTSMNNLALAYRDAGRLSDALPLIEETLKLSKAKLGPEHPGTLTSMSSLALTYQNAGRLAEALPLLEETVKLQRRKLAPEHPDTLMSMDNLALLYQATGRLSDALPLLEETLALQKAKLGPAHPHTLRTVCHLARALKAQGKLTEAEALLRDVVSRRKALAENYEVLALGLSLLGEFLVETGQGKQAEPLLGECLEVLRKRLPKGHRHIAQIECLLGKCLTSLERHTEAESLLLSGYETLKTAQGVPPATLKLARQCIVQLYEAWDKPEKATEWRSREIK
jgi:serine/threonine protein kinase